MEYTKFFKNQMSFICLIMIMGHNLFAQESFNIQLSENKKGISGLLFEKGNSKVYIDKDKILGEFNITYKNKGETFKVHSIDVETTIASQKEDKLQLDFKLPDNVKLNQKFHKKGDVFYWDIEILNKTDEELVITDFGLEFPIGSIDRSRTAKENLVFHKSINGNASFCYWVPYSGEGPILLMTMTNQTSLEYYDFDGHFELFPHAGSISNEGRYGWRTPVSEVHIPMGKRKSYGFKFQFVNDIDQLSDVIVQEGGITFRIAPGMTLPNNLPALIALKSEEAITNITTEYPNKTSMVDKGKKNGHNIYEILFKKLGENRVNVTYGSGKKAYFDFFVTEPMEVLIKKRAKFITERQQHTDTSKWYNGLYSIWDMQNAELLSPDYKHNLPDFVVGGSDDPSNGKALYVSEKNIVYPNKDEIAALEYYEENFVWGGLQRRDDEFPYPYGIYGSENWYENRSGEVAGYNSGGWGKERMWRTFDYTTHFALYYNLYIIARDYPDMINYLDADGYLDRAYYTAKAYFEIPYNILMGEKWSFNGWTDWAYKQGNFHERYLLDLIEALNKHGKTKEADYLRREWEKKVKYFIYDDPWPFGSEMFVDRTAFESSYYIAEYAKENKMKPQEQLWFDKNKLIWYSHTSLSDSVVDVLMQKQFNGNLALRGILEPGYNLLGSARTSIPGLDYMSQMGGTPLLDYGRKFSSEPAWYINLGYNSILSSWALMNTGTSESNYGYWFPGEKNDGAVGWNFEPLLEGVDWYQNISKRGPWRYCGEIDHGLVAGVHDQSTYLVNDPILGLIAYGGEVNKNKNDYQVITKDGVRRRIFFLVDNKKAGIELLQDGFMKDMPITCSETFDRFSFQIENRTKTEHNLTIYLHDFQPGSYAIKIGNEQEKSFTVQEGSKKHILDLNMNNKTLKVTIKRNH